MGELIALYVTSVSCGRRYDASGISANGRELFEQALARCVAPTLTEKRMELYLFGGTAIIIAPDVASLLFVAADLLAHFVDNVDEVDFDSARSWLKAGMTTSEPVYVDHLPNMDGLRTIPFLESRPAPVVEIEYARRGSRVFIDSEVILPGVISAFPIIKWAQMTGRGVPLAGITEFLWPVIAFKDEISLISITRRVHTRWKSSLDQKQWSRSLYSNELLDLDETLKLFIRSLAEHYSSDTMGNFLLSLLPMEPLDTVNTRFEWGVWFQILKALLECEPLASKQADRISYSFNIVKQALRSGGFFQQFMNELRLPDYLSFRAKLIKLGVN